MVPFTDKYNRQGNLEAAESPHGEENPRQTKSGVRVNLVMKEVIVQTFAGPGFNRPSVTQNSCCARDTKDNERQRIIHRNPWGRNRSHTSTEGSVVG